VIRLVGILVVVSTFMLVEARRAARNEAAQRARGAIEPAHDVYPLMQIMYPGVFLAMILDGALHAPPASATVAAGALIFAAGKALKWWAIVTLGDCWTFRVLVVPGAPPIHRGPYRLLRHPNYIGVAGELAGTALMAGSAIAGPIGTVMFVALMGARVRVENRALNAILAPRDRLASRDVRHADTR
jgi:methyltransferase